MPIDCNFLAFSASFQMLWYCFQAGWPDWANFCPFGWQLTLSSFLKITKAVHSFGLLFSTVKVINFDGKFFGLQFGWLFHQLTWSPCFQVLFLCLLPRHSAFCTWATFSCSENRWETLLTSALPTYICVHMRSLQIVFGNGFFCLCEWATDYR
jgi:hypothetical protein